MSNDFPNRQSIRLKGFDYSTQALYFVTICTHNRENLFGEIVGVGRDRPECGSTEMELNKCGKIVESVWKSLPKHHNVILDCFQIMPNHIHFNILLMGGSRPAPTLGLIVGFLKSESTKQIRKYVLSKIQIWQRNYFEHIIRNETEYDKICYYIIHNPELWNRDRNNLNNYAH